MRIPIWLLALLTAATIWILAFKLNPYLADRQRFDTIPVTPLEQPIQDIIGTAPPKDASSLHAAKRQPRGETRKVVMISFVASNAATDQFFDALGKRLIEGRFPLPGRMNVWGCSSRFLCPIPWWNAERTPQQRSFILEEPVLFYVTSDAINDTQRRVNMLSEPF